MSKYIIFNETWQHFLASDHRLPLIQLGTCTKYTKDHDYSVVCLGCSFTYGSHSSAGFHKGFPFYLSQIVNDHVEVWNCGHSGFGTWINIFLAPFLAPDIVVFQLMEPWRRPSSSEIKHISALFKYKDIARIYRRSHRINCLIWSRLHKSNQLAMKWEEMKKLLIFDVALIRKLQYIYKCPFVFLVNKHHLPYWDHVEKCIDCLREEDLIRKKDRLVQTQFGKESWIASHDSHPNNLRHKLTAEYVLKEINNLI